MDMETYAQAYIFLVVNKRLYKRLCPPVYPGVCKAKVEKLEYGHFHHLSLVQILEWAFFRWELRRHLPVVAAIVVRK